MAARSKRTLSKYGLTEESFAALYESQKGCCAICGVSESELEKKHSGAEDWPSDRILHIDHEHGSNPMRVRGLLCWVCNYDLEAFIRQAPVRHPGGRGRSLPRKDPRFTKYLGTSKSARRSRAKRKPATVGPSDEARSVKMLAAHRARIAALVEQVQAALELGSDCENLLRELGRLTDVPVLFRGREYAAARTDSPKPRE